MPPGIVHVQVGQAGNQLGAALLQCLADESSTPEGEPSRAADSHFYLVQKSRGGEARLTARAVLVDMEPKVVQAAYRAGRGQWQYSRPSALTRQSGSGNNWACGYCHHGPAVAEQALRLVRRQVERCDNLSGFLLLQSVAGGTGSGLGCALAQAIRDEYPQARLLSHSIWPYASGEVVPQSYNAVLSLAHLAQQCDGVVLAQNEALSAACQQLLHIQRPSFADLNRLAARDLASVLLPATKRRPPEAAALATAAQQAAGGRPSWDSSWEPPPAAAASSGRGGTSGVGAWDGTFNSGSRWSDDGASGASRGRRGSSAGGDGQRLDPLEDIASQLCGQPTHPLLSLRCVPQMSPGSADFTTFSWPGILKGLAQMQRTGRLVDAGLDWSLGAGASARGGRAVNRTLASMLVLRGQQARQADVQLFADPALYSSSPLRPTAPLLVATSSQRYARLDMHATLLSNCQTVVAPVSRMLDKARLLYSARAYAHHYQRYGLSCADLEESMLQVEDMVSAYRAL